MGNITVALGERSYDVLIDNGLLDRAGELLAPLARDGRLLVQSRQLAAHMPFPSSPP